MAQFKGSIFTATRIFTERQFGYDAVEHCLSELDAADTKVLRGVSPVGWYPVEPVLAYHWALDRLYGKSDLSLCVEAGRFSAEWALNTVLKFFVRFTSPRWMIDKHATLWTRYHDTGRWEIDTEATQHIDGRLYDFAVQDEAFCARLKGWLAGAAALTGGKDVSVDEPACVNRGASHCHFITNWS